MFFRLLDKYDAAIAAGLFLGVTISIALIGPPWYW